MQLPLLVVVEVWFDPDWSVRFWAAVVSFFFVFVKC